MMQKLINITLLNRSLFHILLILAAAVVLHAPHLFSYLGDVNYDFFLHYNWAKEFTENLRMGDSYPRWMFHDRYGLGEPVFMTYSPIYYYLIAIFNISGFDNWISMQLVAILGNAGFAYFVYLTAYRFVSPNISLSIALAALISPFLVMLHYKFHGLAWAAVGYFSHGMLLWATCRPEARRTGFNSWASIAIALAIGTHIISALVNLICYSALCLVRSNLNADGEKLEFKSILIGWGITVGIGLLLSSIYLYPAIYSMKAISPEVWVGDYRLTAFAWPIVTMFTHDIQWFSMQWPISIPALLLIIIITIYYVRFSGEMGCLKAPLQLMLAIGFFSVFFASELSYPIWAFPNPISQINLPYRFISVTYTVSIFGAGLILQHALWNKRKAWIFLVTTTLGVSVLLSVSALIKGTYFDGKPLNTSIHQNAYTFEDAQIKFKQPDYIKQCVIDKNQCISTDRSAGGYSGVPEYALKWSTPKAQWFANKGFISHCIEQGIRCNEPIRLDSGLNFTIHNKKPAVITLPLFHYPSWEVSIGEQHYRSKPDPETGLIQIELEAGTHTVLVRWVATETEKLGVLGSIVGLVILLTITGERYLNRHRRKPAPAI